jgi:hypothetical protein
MASEAPAQRCALVSSRRDGQVSFLFIRGEARGVVPGVELQRKGGWGWLLVDKEGCFRPLRSLNALLLPQRLMVVETQVALERSLTQHPWSLWARVIQTFLQGRVIVADQPIARSIDRVRGQRVPLAGSWAPSLTAKSKTSTLRTRNISLT